MARFGRRIWRWRSHLECAAVAAVFSTAVATPLSAQQTDTLPLPTATLPPVVVTVTRDAARSPLELPFAISATRPDSVRPGQRHLSLDETLFLLPGVTVANRNNPTQDPRISIRGFGARSAFGVRGVRVLRDGIPLTLPDGQTPVDYLDLASIGRIEVIRGSAAALYGNASGGVIDIQSSAPPTDPFAVQLRTWGDSGGVRRWLGSAGGTIGRVQYQGDVGHNETDGFRDYSNQRVTSGFGRVMTTVGTTDLALEVMGYDMPLAENPGALTAAELDTNRTMADPLSVSKEAGKAVRQGQIGLTATHTTGERQLTAMLYGGWRNLDNPLTFAIVKFGRVSYGGGVRSTMPMHLFGLAHRVSIGADVQRQDDDRQNFKNCNPPSATPAPGCSASVGGRGATTLDQRELVSGVGAYIRDELTLAPGYLMNVGVRADYVNFDVTDHFITADDPDDSGDRTLHAISPTVGIVARLNALTSLYANVATAFETPTTTELANRPDSSGGINPNLKPQYSTTYETGVKGLALGHVQYDVAAFATMVRDELIPFEVPDGQGRTFYRNAGRTHRYGAELGLSTVVGAFEGALSYSYSHFRFAQFQIDSITNYAGNRIPGIPLHQAEASLTWRHRSVFVTAEGEMFGRVYVDDQNDASAAGYHTMNLRMGGTTMFGQSWFSPVIGIQNVFDAHYVGSVSVNASGGKYYEPAPGRVIFAGLTLAVGR
ncbi:MAG TPA: TonB-dependent receptor [Gemmatimonadaceae bacterium]|jgi:iron complex outermembrane receptor protein|nr:TonB-dependent receptor [Gemmatimonadaceae bacterium]